MLIEEKVITQKQVISFIYVYPFNPNSLAVLIKQSIKKNSNKSSINTTNCFVNLKGQIIIR